jgi:DNA-binding transcriptional ArsR family regulator
MSHQKTERAPANHKELMRAMGTPPGDGFDPMPPRQIRSLMDRGEREHIRILAWIWKHTSGNPGKGRKRYPYARDARGILGNQHIAGDLRMSPSAVSSALKRLIEQGRVRRDEEGRIYPCGDAPDPELYADIPGGEEEAKTLSTENWHPRLKAYFQQVPQNLNSEVAADCEALMEFGRKLEADAIKIARDENERLVEAYLQARGYQGPEQPPRGRPRKAPEHPVVQLSLVEAPNLSVQINGFHRSEAFVQKPGDLPYTTENGGVQISASLLGFSESSESFRVSTEPAAVATAPAAPAPAATDLPTSKKPSSQKEGEPNPVVEAVERVFGKLPPDGTLRARYSELPEEFGLPALSVCRFLAEKLGEKRAAGYNIKNAGALLQFARMDLPGWAQQHGREIESDRKWEEAEQRQRAQERGVSADRKWEEADQRQRAQERGVSADAVKTTAELKAELAAFARRGNQQAKKAGQQ